MVERFITHSLRGKILYAIPALHALLYMQPILTASTPFLSKASPYFIHFIHFNNSYLLTSMYVIHLLSSTYAALVFSPFHVK